MLNNGSDALVDQHTRFLMRFDNDFKVDGYPHDIEDGLSIKGGEFVTDSIRTGYKYTNTYDSFGMIDTFNSLSPDLFGNGDPFTMIFGINQYKLLTLVLLVMNGMMVFFILAYLMIMAYVCVLPLMVDHIRSMQVM